MSLTAASAVLRTSLTASSATLRTALVAPPTAGPFPTLAPNTLQISPLAVAAVLRAVSGRARFVVAASAGTASLGNVVVNARFPVTAMAASGTLGDVSAVAPGLAEVSALEAAASLGAVVPRTVFPVAPMAAQGVLANVSGVAAGLVGVDALAAEAALGAAVARAAFPVAALAGSGSRGAVQPRVIFPVAPRAASASLGAVIPAVRVPVAPLAGEGTLGAVEAVTAIDPADWFTGGDAGDVWINDPAYYYTDTAATTLVSTVGDSVAAWKGSINGVLAVQGTSAQRPKWQQSGGVDYLESDGTDDSMAITMPATISGSGDDGLVGVGFRFNTNKTQYVFNGSANATDFSVLASSSANLTARVRGTGNGDNVLESQTTGVNRALVMTWPTTNGAAAGNRVFQGSAAGLNVGTITTNASTTFVIFARTGGVYLDGRIYGLVIRDREETNSATRADMATWLAGRM
jgi:hypothetical protein